MQPVKKTYKAGAFLFHEKDHSRELYIVKSGTVKVVRSVCGAEIELARFGAGAVLGEMALIDGKPRSASAVALRDSTVVIVDADTILAKIRGVPQWFISIIRMTSLKVRRANERLHQGRKSHPAVAVVLALQHLLSRPDAGGEPADSQVPDLARTRGQLMQLVGVTSERVENVLGFLRANALLRIDGKGVRLENPDIFKEYCTFLRIRLRKGFERLSPLSEHARTALVSLTEDNPEMRGSTERTTVLDGARLHATIQRCGLDRQWDTVRAEFRDRSLGNVRTDQSSAGSPDAAELVVDTALWGKYYLFEKYRDKVPAS